MVKYFKQFILVLTLLFVHTQVAYALPVYFTIEAPELKRVTHLVVNEDGSYFPDGTVMELVDSSNDVIDDDVTKSSIVNFDDVPLGEYEVREQNSSLNKKAPLIVDEDYKASTDKPIVLVLTGDKVDDSDNDDSNNGSDDGSNNGDNSPNDGVPPNDNDSSTIPPNGGDSIPTEGEDSNDGSSDSDSIWSKLPQTGKLPIALALGLVALIGGVAMTYKKPKRGKTKPSKNGRKTLMLLGLLLSLPLFSSVNAEEINRTVNVTVPTDLSIVFNSDGSNTISDFKISNNSLVPVTLDNVSLTSVNGWDLVPSDTEFHADDKRLSMALDGNDLIIGDNPVSYELLKNSEKALNFAVKSGVWLTSFNEKSFDLEVSYSIGTSDFDLTFNSDNGSLVDSITAPNGSKVTLPEPTKDGFTFIGWLDSSNVLHNVGSDFIVPIGGESFTAQWEVYDPNLIVTGSNFNQLLFSMKSFISEVNFVDSLPVLDADSTSIHSWDISLAGDGSIIAYLDFKLGPILNICSDDAIVANENLSSMFSGFAGLKSINFNEYFDTSHVKNMTSVFDGCSSLTGLDLSSWDTSNVESMYFMFRSCTSLVDLNVTGWNTSKVTDMGGMFTRCTALVSLDLSTCDVSNVVYMNSMFNACSSLVNVNLTSWVTPNVVDFSSMFNSCTSLVSVDLSSFVTDSATSFSFMFSNSDKLVDLDLSSWNVGSVTDFSYMFQGCIGLTNLNVSTWKTSSAIDVRNMFYNCSSLTSLDVSNFDTSLVEDLSSMFAMCTNLTSLDLSSFNTSKVTNFSSMFNTNLNLESLDLSSFDMSLAQNVSSMFYNNPKLSSHITVNFNISDIWNYGNMFYSTSTLEGSQLLVDFEDGYLDTAKNLLSTKSSNSNVILNQFTVSFLDTSLDAVEGKSGDEIILTEPVKDGFKFTGWKSSDDVIYNVGDSFIIPLHDVELTAQWEIV